MGPSGTFQLVLVSIYTNQPVRACTWSRFIIRSIEMLQPTLFDARKPLTTGPPDHSQTQPCREVRSFDSSFIYVGFERCSERMCAVRHSFRLGRSMILILKSAIWCNRTEWFTKRSSTLPGPVSARIQCRLIAHWKKLNGYEVRLFFWFRFEACNARSFLRARFYIHHKI